MVNKPLTVYKASAGSGKTFTLATEYIKFVVQDPTCYRNILAVTFTNKATEEMKTRILSQLYGISHGLPDSQAYTERICQQLDASPEFVARQAGIALNNLLHNYNYFRVQTIDTFFQGVLRNLARELELTPNLRIGLNDNQVEELAVDQMIEDLSTTDVLLQWIMKYVMENIEDYHSWNVIGKIKQFGRTIFKEYYKQVSKELDEKLHEEDFFNNYTATLRQMRNDARMRMFAIAESFFDTLESEQLSIDDLSGKSRGIASFFRKLQLGIFDDSIINATVAKHLDNPDNWCTKSHPRRDLITFLASETLGDILRYACDERPRQWKIFKSADLTLRHLNQLRLLSSIEQKVNELNESASRFLLSNTQEVLHALIQDSDTPFIFEKIGTLISHVMIDEFQDTSVIQWKNFKVLLQESMSHHDAENLIVGDVKQSIYRWRSGDWRLLNDIESEFPTPDQQLSIRTLDTNYRSSRNVIEFNNHFFKSAVDIEKNALDELDVNESEQLTKAYSDVCQNVPASRIDSGGRVDVVLLPADEYEEQVLQQVAARVTELQQHGIPLSDVACLLRTNRQIATLASFFTKNYPDIHIVSEEAFRLDASPAVNILCSALQLLAHPDNQLAKALLVKSFADTSVINLAEDDIDKYLPDEFRQQRDALLRQPLYELTETLVRIFKLNEMPRQAPYLCVFLDELVNYLGDHVGDIDEFLQEWDTTLRQKTIQSDEAEGLRLLSIHKSKGLEYPHVIIPFCDWQLEKSTGNIIWCQPTEAPFSNLPLVPVDCSQKQLMGTIYEHDYLREHLQNVVDNLNLLYVAFTRASESLMVIGRRKARNSRSIVIEQVLPVISQQLDGAILDGETDEQQLLTFSYGTLSHHKEAVVAAKPASRNVFAATSQPMEIRLEEYANKMNFRQSNQSRAFVNEETATEEEQQQAAYIKLGSILHDIFAHISTAADVDAALQQLESNGVLYDDHITPEKLSDMIRKRLQTPTVAEWFSGQWELFNECTILSIDPQTNAIIERRPDRVMKRGDRLVVVDFKFGRPHDEHQQQVLQYMDLLHQMGYTQVEGYLWYVYTNKIVEVK